MDAMSLEAPAAALARPRRRSGRRAARGGDGSPRSGVRARGCGNRQDPHHHPTHRVPGRGRSRRAGPGAGGDVHVARRGRDARPACVPWTTRRARRGTGAMQAMTFHAAARRQLHYFWPRVVGDTGWELLDSKFGVVAQAANRAAMQVSTDDVRDLAGEIEWAKASLISPEGYAAAVAKVGRDIPARRRQDRHRLRRLRGRQGPPRRHDAARLRRPAAAHRGRHRERCRRSPRSSGTATAASSSTSTRTSRRCSSGC